MNKIISAIIILATVFAAGCSTTSTKTEVSMLKSRSIKHDHYQDNLTFALIDGQQVDSLLWSNPAHMEIKVAEGSHAITFDLERYSGAFSDLMGAQGVLQLEAKVGRTYVMNSEGSGDKIRVWMEDVASSQRVSEVVTIKLEPRSGKSDKMLALKPTDITRLPTDYQYQDYTKTTGSAH